MSLRVFILIRYLNHSDSDDSVADFVTLLENFRDGVFREFFIVNVHYSIVNFRVKCIALFAELNDAELCIKLLELLVNKQDAVLVLFVSAFLLHSSADIIENREE